MSWSGCGIMQVRRGYSQSPINQAWLDYKHTDYLIIYTYLCFNWLLHLLSVNTNDVPGRDYPERKPYPLSDRYSGLFAVKINGPFREYFITRKHCGDQSVLFF